MDSSTSRMRHKRLSAPTRWRDQVTHHFHSLRLMKKTTLMTTLAWGNDSHEPSSPAPVLYVHSREKRLAVITIWACSYVGQGRLGTLAISIFIILSPFNRNRPRVLGQLLVVAQQYSQDEQGRDVGWLVGWLEGNLIALRLFREWSVDWLGKTVERSSTVCALCWPKFWVYASLNVSVCLPCCCLLNL
jgi:hypothetical protein